MLWTCEAFPSQLEEWSKNLICLVENQKLHLHKCRKFVGCWWASVVAAVGCYWVHYVHSIVTRNAKVLICNPSHVFFLLFTYFSKTSKLQITAVCYKISRVRHISKSVMCGKCCRIPLKVYFLISQCLHTGVLKGTHRIRFRSPSSCLIKDFPA